MNITDENQGMDLQKLHEFKIKLSALKAKQIELVSYDASRSATPMYAGSMNNPFAFERGSFEEVFKAQSYTDLGDLIEIKITSNNRTMLERLSKERNNAQQS